MNEEHYFKPWVRTKYINGQWLWRHATDKEIADAKAANMPVHLYVEEIENE